jgi:hypothetical protein
MTMPTTVFLGFVKGIENGVVHAIVPMGLAAASSGPAESDGFLWVIKIRKAHFLRRGSKAARPLL